MGYCGGGVLLVLGLVGGVCEVKANCAVSAAIFLSFLVWLLVDVFCLFLF